MKLTTAEIQEFQKLFRSEVGIDISLQNAESLGMELLNLMQQIYKPIDDEGGLIDQKQNEN